MTAVGSIAAFDFDGTLTTRDTVVPFLRSIIGTPRLVVGLGGRCHHVVAAAARRDRDRLREIATGTVFAGRPIEDVERHATEHADSIRRHLLRPDTVARLEWHRSQGHALVIISASYESYVRPVAAHLGVDSVLATRLEVGPDGRCTGRLDGANCRGAEKVRRLVGWLDDHGTSLEDVTLWAYGDSAGDDELLAVADHPHRVDAPLGNV